MPLVQAGVAFPQALLHIPQCAAFDAVSTRFCAQRSGAIPLQTLPRKRVISETDSARL